MFFQYSFIRLLNVYREFWRFPFSAFGEDGQLRATWLALVANSTGEEDILKPNNDLFWTKDSLYKILMEAQQK